MERDLDTVDPQPVIVRLKGVDRELRPVVAGNIPRLVRAVQPFMQKLFDLPDGVLQRPGENAVAVVSLILDMLGEHGDQILEALAAASGIARAEVNALTADELCELGLKAWEVNADFFTRRLGPLLAGRATAARGGGRTRSTS